MHALTREAVASFPELTDRAPLALVVDALLMRAADDVWGSGSALVFRVNAPARRKKVEA